MPTAMQKPEVTDITVVAMGGHSLLDPALPPTVANQFKVTHEALVPVADLVAAGQTVVLTHGNGPQVGFLKRRSELAKDQIHEVPLDSLVADTQGALGFMIQRALRHQLTSRQCERPVATVVTEVVVDRADSAFQKPTKPIGSFMSAEVAEQMKAQFGWHLVEDSGRGYRRVVPSPMPKAIVQLDTIKALLSAGTTVVACGGGGIPVTSDEHGELQGVEAVIDKDLSSALLAIALGAKRLIITTGVDAVCKDFRSGNPVKLPRPSLSEIKALHAEGQFPPGSMGPKIEAGILFLENGGECVIICRPEHLVDAFAGRTGTTIVKD